MKVSIGFFDDIYIPVQYLPQPSALYVSISFPLHIFLHFPTFYTISDPNERAHFWIPDSPLTTVTELLETPLTDRMYIDQGEVTRVRVEADDFCDDEPGPPKVTEGAAGSSVQVNREHQRRAPYIVCVSLLDVLREWSGLNHDFTTRSVRLQSRDLVLWHGGLVLNRLTKVIQ